MKLLFIIISCIFLMSFSLPAKEKIVPLPDIPKAQFISIDDSQIYITHTTTVYILSRKDFKLIKKFGKPGQGPGEFQMLIMGAYPHMDKLVIPRMGRVSIFKKDGTHISEANSKGGTLSSMMLKPLKDNFVGVGMKVIEGKAAKMEVTLYKNTLDKIKTLSGGIEFSINKKMDLFQFSKMEFDVDEDRIITAEARPRP